MAYLLEDVTQVDISKILSDCKINEDIRWQIEYAVKDGGFSKKWAIDRSINSYLIMLPDIVKDPFTLSKFMFYFNIEIYSCFFNGTFESAIDIKMKNDFDADSLSLFQNCLSEAFDVYGRYGDGILNSVGQPEYKVVQVFNNQYL